MCGFAGFFGNVREPARLLSAMADAVSHRGPDDRGHFIGSATGTAPQAGLAHVRLSIVGLDDSHQPMISPDGKLVIAFNGEIFNHVELRKDLIARGHVFRTSGDTEVLLQLYDRLGEKCLSLLNGDFSFAIWDGRRNRVFLARDRMGVRPLFYMRHAGTLYFASEIKALLTVPGFQAALDPLALDQIFTLWSPIGPRTAFAGVSEIEPGTSMVANPDGEHLSSYWHLDFPDAADARADEAGDTKSTEELRYLLGDATRLRLRADVPVGACLSGGLDSSIVSALAAEYSPRGLKTFSVAFQSPEFDESAFQQEMARHLNVHQATTLCTNDDISYLFPEVIRLAETPLIRTAPAPMLKLSSLIRQNGIKVVLTGEGADEVFAGYDIFREAHVRRFCARQPGSTKRPALFRKLYPYMPALHKQTPESLAAFFGVHATSLEDPLFSHRPRLNNTAAAKMFFSADLKETLRGYDAADDMIGCLPERFRRWHPLHQAQYLETRFLLPGYILSSQGDRMSMGNGVEGRYPFLDHRVVEFASTLPPQSKLRGLREKHILREALGHRLPQSIVERAKQPYRAPDSRSFVGQETAGYVEEVFDTTRLADHGLFNPLAVNKLVEKCRNSHAPGFRSDTAFVGILSTGLWLDAFTKPKNIMDAAKADDILETLA